MCKSPAFDQDSPAAPCDAAVSQHLSAAGGAGGRPPLPEYDLGVLFHAKEFPAEHRYRHMCRLWRVCSTTFAARTLPLPCGPSGTRAGGKRTQSGLPRWAVRHRLPFMFYVCVFVATTPPLPRVPTALPRLRRLLLPPTPSTALPRLRHRPLPFAPTALPRLRHQTPPFAWRRAEGPSDRDAVLHRG